MTFRSGRVRVIAFVTVFTGALGPGVATLTGSGRIVPLVFLVLVALAGAIALSIRITPSAGGLEVRRLWQRWYFPAEDIEVEWGQLVSGLGRGTDTALNVRRRSGGRAVSIPLSFFAKEDVKTLQREVESMLRGGRAGGRRSG